MGFFSQAGVGWNFCLVGGIFFLGRRDFFFTGGVGGIYFLVGGIFFRD